MTINNLHFKCEDLRNEMIISKKEYEESGVEKTTKNYNDSGLSCKKAIEQIKIIQQVVINFNDLSHDLESKYPEIKEALEKFRNEKNNKWRTSLRTVIKNKLVNIIRFVLWI